MEHVRVEREGGGVAVVTIDRQEKLNALNARVQREITEVFEQALPGETRAAVITGAGERAFVAGADAGEMGSLSALEIREFGRIGTRMMEAIEQAPFPVIAAINGYALGGGLELALACDIRVAAENAVFGFPEVTIGIMPGAGGTQRLPRVIGSGIARELVFTGRMVSAREAKEIGLVNRVVGEGEALGAAREMARQIAGNAPLAVRSAKIAMNVARNTDLASGIEHEGDLFALLFTTEDAREGLSAFAGRRKPEFKGR
ncbi:short chain enoyl-CoA hydratase [Rubrobacter xylanophilus DSM 9941]|uniref:enoyl-CoA hydratase n=1 Tax=Rubrobacter xylanophilus (strain DSM 9941 / JCM 11954 / NBRC 16129 / PRD-1) TaxID=266117 RepID=Q1AZ30_RUBXD|nr:enoyl-CoA hydratase-related protein [Rubrobacter xylanophilus]ABG03348.1 short chain enoyl-CoA hydratase [Rubrobacter xylanophilus DSM 9941]